MEEIIIEKDNVKRAPQQRIKVTFPDGESFCFKNAVDTFIATLKKIGSASFPLIKLERNHRPILTTEPYKDLEKYMKPVCDGWFVNTQNDTHEKVLLLKSISDILNIGLIVEHGTDLKVTDKVERTPGTRPKTKLIVTFPDGAIIEDENFINVFRQVIYEIGVYNIGEKIVWKGKPLVTTTNIDGRRSQLGPHHWYVEPQSAKETEYILKKIVIQLHKDIKINRIKL